MNELAPLFTVFISGLFGLIVALLTWMLANRREKSKFKQELLYRDYKDKESFYISIIASLDKLIRLTMSSRDHFEMFNEMTMNSAKINVYGSKKINDKLVEVSDILYTWSSEYKQSLPKKISETDLALVSTENFKHKEIADKIYPELIVLIQELTTEIQIELKYLRKQMEK